MEKRQSELGTRHSATMGKPGVNTKVTEVEKSTRRGLPFRRDLCRSNFVTFVLTPALDKRRGRSQFELSKQREVVGGD